MVLGGDFIARDGNREVLDVSGLAARMEHVWSLVAVECIVYGTKAIRLAGVYALAGLADDWQENRQTCVDVLPAKRNLRLSGPVADGVENTWRSSSIGNPA